MAYNAPFSRAKPLDAFVRRMGQHGQGVALIPLWPDTDLWSDAVWSTASAMLFMRRRIRFLNPDGSTPRGNAPFPTALVAYGPDDAEVLRTSGIEGRFLLLGE